MKGFFCNTQKAKVGRRYINMIKRERKGEEELHEEHYSVMCKSEMRYIIKAYERVHSTVVVVTAATTTIAFALFQEVFLKLCDARSEFSSGFLIK